MKRVPYDDFAEIYDAWIDAFPLAEDLRSFYVELLAESPGPVAELGVGNGHICVQVARRGKPITGVDSSPAILELCRQHAEAAGAAEHLELLHADFRDFRLAEPAALIVLPFHSMGHLLDDEQKRRCMTRVHGQLAPGGRFVWDHFVFDPDLPVNVLTLVNDWRDPETGARKLIWKASGRDDQRRLIELLARVEDLDERGTVVRTRHLRMEVSWIDPERSRELLSETGFEIEALYGDFRRGPFQTTSSHQVWVARRT